MIRPQDGLSVVKGTSDMEVASNESLVRRRALESEDSDMITSFCPSLVGVNECSFGGVVVVVRILPLFVCHDLEA
jgi:hypothetical protein